MNRRDGIGGCSSVEGGEFVFFVERRFFADLFLRLDFFFFAKRCLSWISADRAVEDDHIPITPELAC